MPEAFDKWLHLWKIKSPPKWKAFMWRALSNTLPTTMNLNLKRVDVSPTCPMCGVENENTMHALFNCDFSKLVWHESSLHIPSIGTDLLDWFVGALTVLSAGDLLLAVAVMYHLWKARNKAVWEYHLPRPGSVWRMARSAVDAWQ